MHCVIACKCFLQHQGTLKGILKNTRGLMIKSWAYVEVQEMHLNFLITLWS